MGDVIMAHRKKIRIRGASPSRKKKPQKVKADKDNKTEYIENENSYYRSPRLCGL